MTARTHLAVVGGGAAAVALLMHLVEHLQGELARSVRITVIESAAAVGPGLAYQEDVQTLVLNRIAGTMSVDAENASMFVAWMAWKRAFRPDVARAMDEAFPAAYVPRAHFGAYLRDCFAELLQAGTRRGLQIEVLNERVLALQRRPDGYRLALHGSTLAADAVLLCTGHTAPRDHHGLGGHARHIGQVYPLAPRLDALRSSQAVCILGASLTAVDIAVSLHAAGYRGRIDMLSVRGLLPYVRGKDYSPCTLRHLTWPAVQDACAKAGGALGLRGLLRLFRRELRDHGCDWRRLLSPRWPHDAQAFLEQELQAAQGRRAWQLVLPALNPLLHDLWNVLREPDKDLFLRRFGRAWMACRTPIPMKNAQVLHRMMEAGQLRVFRGPACWRAQGDSRIAMQHPEHGEIAYDWVLNATGSSAQIASGGDSTLLWQMVEAGLAVPDPRGGIRVDFGSGSVIGRDAVPDPMLRATGHVTSGAYFYVDSLDMISRQSRRVAASFCRHLASRRTRATLNEPAAASLALG
jgi:uncharacterized NAD(P)/FAD-binding protein YdhS